jgi:hypothetical protein
LSLDVTSPPPSRETGTDTNAGVTCRIPGLWTFICCNTRDTLEWCSLLSPVEVVRAPSPRSLVHTPASGRIPSHIGRTHRRASHPRCLPDDDRQPAPSRPVEPHLQTSYAIALTSGLPVRRLGANAARACRLGVNNRAVFHCLQSGARKLSRRIYPPRRRKDVERGKRAS